MLDTPEWSMCAHGSAGPLFLFGVLIRRSKKPFESVFQHLDRPRVGCFRQQIWIFENPCPVRSAGNGHCRLLMPIVTEVLNISCTSPSMFLSIYLSMYPSVYHPANGFMFPKIFTVADPQLLTLKRSKPEIKPLSRPQHYVRGM